MTNSYSNGIQTLLFGTLTSPNTIQVIENNKINEYTLDFSQLISNGMGTDTAYYDVIVTGKRKGKNIIVNEIVDSPEESGVSVFRLFGEQQIKWGFSADCDFKERAENIKVLQLFSNDYGIDVPEFERVYRVQTVVERYDARLPKLFIYKEKYGDKRDFIIHKTKGEKNTSIKFYSIQLGNG